MVQGEKLEPEFKARVALLDIAAARRSETQLLAKTMPAGRMMEVHDLIPVVLARLKSLATPPAAERHEGTYERRRRQERTRDYDLAQVYQDLYQIYSGLRTIEELAELTNLPLDAEGQAALPIAIALLDELAPALYNQPLPDEVTQAALQAAAADS
jgi:hypothetical protein